METPVKHSMTIALVILCIKVKTMNAETSPHLLHKN
jgi:hypothetical protein